MGKKQHQSDKLYITSTEWSTIYGGKKKSKCVEQASAQASALQQNVLPLNFCALALAPFTFPVTTSEGFVFDFINLVSYLKTCPKGAAKNPVTGTPMTVASVIPLKFHKNRDDAYHCPVTFKLLTDQSHVVAIKCTGNVYSRDAIDNFNLKPKYYKDLLTDEAFIPSKDLITLRNPATTLDRLNIGHFGHVVERQKTSNQGGTPLDDLSSGGVEVPSNINYTNNEMRAILKELMENTNPTVMTTTSTSNSVSSLPASSASVQSAPIFHAHYSQGRVAASFTCSAIAPQTAQVLERLDVDSVRYARLARAHKKAYAQIQTNLGPLNVELHCDAAPRACENWLKLAAAGAYDNLIFFRSIRHFVAQTGDPNETLEAFNARATQAVASSNKREKSRKKGVGPGGSKTGTAAKEDESTKKPSFSCWGSYFEDEFRHVAAYNHTGRGVMSMANLGKPNTNGSQFFITYRSCRQLDKVHTVFGRVVGGLETIDKMEKIPVDDKTYAPLEPIYILSCSIYVDPYKELDEEIRAEQEMERETEAIEAKRKAIEKKGEVKNKKVKTVDTQASSVPTANSAPFNEGVGKYLKLPTR